MATVVSVGFGHPAFTFKCLQELWLSVSTWPELEEDLRAPVAEHLRSRGFRVRHETWINGRIADLYGFHEDGDTVAVELKLTDWREAAVQAMAYQLGALYTYVALPVQVVPRVMKRASALRRHGIGLLAVDPGQQDPEGFQRADQAPEAASAGTLDPEVRVLIEAGPSDRYLPFLAEKIVRDAKRPKRVGTVLPMD